EYNLVAIVQGFILLVLTMLFLWVLRMGINGTLIATILSWIFAGIFAFALAVKASGGIEWRMNFSYLKNALRYGLIIHMSNILRFLSLRVNLFLVNSFSNPAAVGFYSISVGLTEKLWLISQAAAIVLFPKIAMEKDEIKKKEFTPIVARTVLWIMIFTALIIFLLSQWLISFLYSQTFLPAVAPLKILLLGTVAVGLSQIFGNDIAGRDRPVLNVYANITGFVSIIVLSILWIPKYGIKGAAWASTISYVFSSIITALFYVRISGNPLRAILLPRRADWSLYWQIGKSLWQWVGKTLRIVEIARKNFVKIENIFVKRSPQTNDISAYNIAFITRRFDFQYTGGTKIREDMIKACQRIGIRVICLSGKIIRYFLSLARLSLKDVDYILLLYPNVPTMRHTGLSAFVKNFVEISLLWIKKKQFHLKIILFIQDLPIEQINAMKGLQSLPQNRWLERILFSISDVIGVVGSEMEEMISQNYAAVTAKSVHYRFPPYFGPVIRRDIIKLEYPIQVAFVGDLFESRLKGVIHSISETRGIQYNFYGPRGEWLRELKRSDIRYVGVYSPEEIGRIISKENHVGLLLYDPTNEKITHYMSMAVTIKFMTYIFSGLPVITYSRYKNIAKTIIDYNLGWIFDEPGQIPCILSELDDNCYHDVVENVTKFAESIVMEDYFEQFIKASLSKLSHL
ncbi:MAG: polysaccharide biosynthesis C-terminal domain-containing protein, partial [Candidatus Methanomethylicaceae archaeon]